MGDYVGTMDVWVTFSGGHQGEEFDTRVCYSVDCIYLPRTRDPFHSNTTMARTLDSRCRAHHLSRKCSNSLFLVNFSYTFLARSHMHHPDLGLLALEN
jgi:hypothetical protein